LYKSQIQIIKAVFEVLSTKFTLSIKGN